MTKKLLCYKCFEKFQPHEVHFRCDNPFKADDNRTNACVIEDDPKLKTKAKHAFKLHGFWAFWRANWQDPMNCKCDLCKYPSRTRLCPICHGKLSVAQGQIDERVIALVGDSSSGKSHAFAVLIERVLRGRIGRGFEAAILTDDHDSQVLYNAEFYEPLFAQGREITGTRPEESKDRRMVFRLIIKRGAKRKILRLTLVFYDIAGALLTASSDKRDDAATRFLWHSSGIIFLDNPQRIPAWKKLLNSPNMERPSEAEFVYRGMVEELRKRKDIRIDKRIPIPLAVCISQFDRLRERREEAGLDAALFESGTTPVRNGAIDLGQVRRESDAIKAFMEAHGGFPANLTRQAEEDFFSVGFFGVSALGASPDTDGRIHEITPCRLETPFFWILSELGLLKRKRS